MLELPRADEEKSDRQFVTALARGLEVLRAFRPEDGPLGNQELAERSGLPKPTVVRLTHTLTMLGYLEYVPRFAKYRIGLGVLALGHECIGGAALRHVAQPHMQELADYAGTAVALGGRDRLSMIYLDVYRGAHTSAFSLAPGARIPIYKSAMGTAYLWALPAKEREFLMSAIRQRTDEEWPAIKRQLDTGFKSLDRAGFCIAEGTYDRAINGAGAVLVLQGSNEIYAFSCSGAAFHLTAARLKDDIGPRLAALTNIVGTELNRQTRRF